MGATLYDKVFDAHTVRVLPSGHHQLFVRLHLVHDATSPQAFRVDPNTGLPVDGNNGTGMTIDGTNPDGPISGGTTNVDATAYTNNHDALGSIVTLR